MLEAEVAGSPKFEPFFARAGAGPSLMLRLPFSDSLNALLHGSYKWRAPTTKATAYAYGGEVRLGIASAAALNLRAVRYPVSWEYSAGMLYYF
jgi:hypothetical protein